MLFSGQILTIITPAKREGMFLHLSVTGGDVSQHAMGVYAPLGRTPRTHTHPPWADNPLDTDPQTKLREGMFLHLSVTGGRCIPACNGGVHPSPLGRPPPRTHAHPPWADNPPGHRPANEVAGRYVFTLVCHGGRCIPACNGSVRPPGHIHTLPGQTTPLDTPPRQTPPGHTHKHILGRHPPR